MTKKEFDEAVSAVEEIIGEALDEQGVSQVVAFALLRIGAYAAKLTDMPETLRARALTEGAEQGRDQISKMEANGIERLLG